MDRRAFIAKAFDKSGAADPTPTYENKELPAVARVNAGLEPYAESWEWEEASHLLNRALFGAKRAEIEKAVNDGLSATLDLLLADLVALPEPPVYYQYTQDPNAGVGESWVTHPQVVGTENFGFFRKRSLKNWGVGQMVNQETSIREKMVLFWHNHFGVAAAVVGDARFLYQLNQLLREGALGSIKELVKEVSVSSAMLVFLNGNQNREGKPNENFARELFELFTIGKGPQIGEGNYTNYTEEDIREAARVLTGWAPTVYGKVEGEPGSQFITNWHDKTDKQFSAAFDNLIISDQEGEEYKALVDMIFSKRETARYLSRKLYRWFVYYVIDEATEQHVIEPMAQLLIENDFSVKPALRALLSSGHFFDSENRGCMIKSPFDFHISLLRKTNVVLPDPSNTYFGYKFWHYLRNLSSTIDQDFLDTPTVAGWPAYYQKPVYYQSWISSATLPQRQTAIDKFMSKNGYKVGEDKVKIDSLVLIEGISDPSDPNVLVKELAELLFPLPLSQEFRDELKDILIPGLPDFEWTEEYILYITDPSNEGYKQAVITKLDALLKSMLSLAEFQLS